MKGSSRRWSLPRAGARAENDEGKPGKEQLLVVNLSGRGDKDIFTVHDILKARGNLMERYDNAFAQLKARRKARSFPS